MRKEQLTTTTLLAGEPYKGAYRSKEPVRLIEVDRLWTPGNVGADTRTYRPSKDTYQSRATYYSGRDVGRLALCFDRSAYRSGRGAYTDAQLATLAELELPRLSRNAERASEELEQFIRSLNGAFRVDLVNTGQIRHTWDEHDKHLADEEAAIEQAIAEAQAEEAFSRSIWEPVKQALRDHGITDYRPHSNAQAFGSDEFIHYTDEEAVTHVTLTVPQLVELLLSEAPITGHLDGLMQARTLLNNRAQGEAS